MAEIGALFVGLVVFGIAGLVGRYGRRQQRRRALVAETPTSAVREIAEEGLVELEGRVVADETFRSPIRGDESVLSAWEIEEWNESGTTDQWETRATGVYAAPFALDDGTGEVRVEIADRVEGEDDGHVDIQLGSINFDQFLSSGVSVDDVLCAFERFPVETTVPPDADPPERIAEFVRGESGIAPQTDSITNLVDVGNKHRERRYYEATIEPGQEVYLLGEVRAKPDATRPLGPGDAVVEPPADDGPLILSDQSEEQLLSDLARYKYAYAVAAVLGAVGVALLLVGVGAV